MRRGRRRWCRRDQARVRALNAAISGEQASEVSRFPLFLVGPGGRLRVIGGTCDDEPCCVLSWRSLTSAPPRSSSRQIPFAFGYAVAPPNTLPNTLPNMESASSTQRCCSIGVVPSRSTLGMNRTASTRLRLPPRGGEAERSWRALSASASPLDDQYRSFRRHEQTEQETAFTAAAVSLAPSRDVINDPADQIEAARRLLVGFSTFEQASAPATAKLSPARQRPRCRPQRCRRGDRPRFRAFTSCEIHSSASQSA